MVEVHDLTENLKLAGETLAAVYSANLVGHSGDIVGPLGSTKRLLELKGPGHSLPTLHLKHIGNIAMRRAGDDGDR